MADLTPIAITKAGFDLAGQLTAADAGGDSFDSTATGLFFAVENTDAGAHTVTIVAPVSNTICPGFGELPITDLVITVGAGETQVFTIPVGYSAQGKFNLTYDAVTNVAVGGFSIA